MGFRIKPRAEEKRTLEQILVTLGALAGDDLKNAQLKATTRRQPLVTVLLEEGYVTEYDLARAYAELHELVYIDLIVESPSPEALKAVPEKLVRKLSFLPIELEGEQLTVAIGDPAAMANIQEIGPSLNLKLVFRIAPFPQIGPSIERWYALTAEAEAETVTTEAAAQSGPMIKKLVLPEIGKISVEEMINRITLAAVEQKASDIHVEPEGPIVRIRFRIDGVLHEMCTMKGEVHPQILSRLKVVSGLDIAEKRNAQDGSFQMQVGDRAIDLRLSTLPTVRGEKAVLRILDKSALTVELDSIGLPQTILHSLK